MLPTFLKLTFVHGLKEVVLDELQARFEPQIALHGRDAIYLPFFPEHKRLETLRSVNAIFAVRRDEKLNPHFLSKHKSIVGELIDIAFSSEHTFKTFKVSCAGSDSKDVSHIQKYIAETYSVI